jgi:hypothetical protein
MSKPKISDQSIKVLRKALRTKLGISAAKPAKKPARREKVEDEDDTPAPRKQKAERLGYADL